MSANSKHVVDEEVESNAPTLNKNSSNPQAPHGIGGEVRDAFFNTMNKWFDHYVGATPPTPLPQGPPFPLIASVVLQPPTPILEPIHQPPLKKLHNFGDEEFKGKNGDDSPMIEYWL